MKPLNVLMPDRTIRTFSSYTDSGIDQALRQGGTAVEISGDAVVHQYSQRQFMGGWLLDHCPINVVMGMGWLPGQIEALERAGIQCGIVPAGTAEYIPPEADCPFGYAMEDGGCNRDWTVSAEAVRAHAEQTGAIPAYDDNGQAVTVQTLPSTTPVSSVPSVYSGDGGGGIAPGGFPWAGGSNGNGEPAANGNGGPNYLPFIILGAIFLLGRKAS